MTSSKFNQAYINALLADAAYVEGFKKGMTGDALINANDAALGRRMTTPQAQFIADNFEIASVKETPDFFGSGFDAVVWRGRTDKPDSPYFGKVFVSMRGTELLGTDLIGADVDLAVSTAARKQIIDMVNWWLLETAPKGQSVRRLIETRQIVFEVDPVNNLSTERLETSYHWDSVIATGGLLGVSSVQVNGHSLGGHLASAFARLFGEQVQISGVSTFNSAGFLRSSEAFFKEIGDMLGTALPGFAPQANYYAQNGLNVTTNEWWFQQIGERIGLNQEEGTGLPNHSMYKLTDMLALGTMLEKLDPNLSFAKLNDLVSAGSVQAKASYEGVLDSVRRLIGGPKTIDTQVGDVGENAVSRTDFHSKLIDLQNHAVFAALVGKLSLSASAASATAAKSNFAQFLSLYDLSPITMSTTDAGAQAALLAARTDVASRWQKLADHFSDAWLSDRSAMQGWLMQAHQKDHASFLVPTSAQATDYEDMASSQCVQAGNATPANLRRVLFGDGAANSLNGGLQSNSLLGLNMKNFSTFNIAGLIHSAGHAANHADWSASA